MPPPELPICQSLQISLSLSLSFSSRCVGGRAKASGDRAGPRPVSEELGPQLRHHSRATEGFLRSLWSGSRFLGSPSQDQGQRRLGGARGGWGAATEAPKLRGLGDGSSSSDRSKARTFWSDPRSGGGVRFEGSGIC